MPSPTDEQQRILLEVGDPNTTLTPIIGTIWNLVSDKTPIQLQYLYAKRAALDQRLAEEAPSVDFQLGKNDVDIVRSQRFAHLSTMRDAVQAEIVRIEAIIRASRAPATGALTTTQPVTPPDPNGPNADDARFRGTPYRSRLPW